MLAKLPPAYNCLQQVDDLLQEAGPALPFRLLGDPTVQSWAELFQRTSGICIGLCAVLPFPIAGGMTCPSTHAVTYDAWRGLLFVGGGNSNEKWLCGLLLVHESGRQDPSGLVTPLRDVLHLDALSSTARLFVQRKQASLTPFNTPKVLARV